MTPPPPLLAAVAVTAAAMLVGCGLDPLRDFRARWAMRRAARTLGLSLAESSMHGIEARGNVDGMSVSIGSRKGRTRVAIEGGRWPRGVSGMSMRLARRYRPGAIERRSRVLTGDAAFDDAILVEGWTAGALAMLGDEARPKVARVLREQGRRGWEFQSLVSEPVILARVGQETSARSLVRAVRGALVIARVTSLTQGVTASLAAHVEQDASAPVRRRNLVALLAHAPAKHPAVVAACRTALQADDIGLRLVAARGLRSEGRAVLDGIVLDETLAAGHRVEALKLRLRLRSPEDVSFLLGALATCTGAVRREIVRRIGRRHLKQALGVLLPLAESMSGDDLAALAEALGSIGDPGAEPALLRIAGFHGGEARLQAVRALGAIGTIQSIETLLPLARAILVPPALRVAARDTIRRIRHRMDPAEAGRLALVAPLEDDGLLSLAEGEGELSPSEPPDDDEPDVDRLS